MGLIKELDKNHSKDDECDRWAIQLRQAVVNATRTRPGWSRSQWTRQFHILKREIADPDRIQTTLDWFALNVGKPYVPVAFAAESFRKAFLRIEAAMNRVQERTAITLGANGIAVRRAVIGYCKAPCDISSLDAAIATSLTNHTDLRAKLAAIRGEFGGNRTVIYVATHLHIWLGQPKPFVTEWLTQGIRHLSEWAEWSGSLRGIVLSAENRRFIAKADSLAANYGSHRSSGMAASASLLGRLAS